MNLLGPLAPWSGSGQEEKLLAAAQRGDRGAFDRLARSYHRTLRGYLARRVGPDAAEDVLQETWIAAWNALPELRGRSRFRAWVFGIAAHKSADHLRARSRTATVDMPNGLEEIAGYPGSRPGAGAAGKDPYAQAELRQIVGDALAQLPESQREVLEMYYYMELTLVEIATALKRNLNTVKYQFYRAHAQVSARLPEEAAQAAKALTPAKGDLLP